jgi:hypothetical protein
MKGNLKAWVPVFGLIVMAVLTTFQQALTDDNVVSTQEWIQVAIQATMAAHVWATANLPQYEKMKTFVAAVVVVLQALYTVVIGGVSTVEVINLAITFLSALGVAFVTQPTTKTIDGRIVLPQDQI